MLNRNNINVMGYIIGWILGFITLGYFSNIWDTGALFGGIYTALFFGVLNYEKN